MTLNIGGGSIGQVLMVDVTSQNYLERDGYSACANADDGGYSLSFSHGFPSWIQQNGANLVVTSDDELDVAESITFTVTLNVNGVGTSSDELDVELVCVTDCENVRVPATLDSVDCNGDGPNYLENIVGNSGDNPVVDEWYPQYKQYILTKVEMWKSWVHTTGFEMTFEPEFDDMENWPIVTHMFGNKELTEYQESVTFKDNDGNNREIKELEICLDTKYINVLQADFEGFRFTMFDDT